MYGGWGTSAPEWAVVVEPPLGRAPSSAPQQKDPAPPTRWVALAAGLLLGVTLIGTGFVVRRAVWPANAAIADLRPGPVRGVPGESYAVTWISAAGTPVRWNPCRAIRWVANPAGAPPGAIEEAKAAFGRLSKASGLRFDFLGSTDEPPSADRAGVQARYGDDWAPLLLAWAPLKGTALGAGLGTGVETVGVATPVAIIERDSAVIVTAQVVLETARPLVAGFGTSESRGSVVLHELAHALGLGHVPDPSQLMAGSGASAGGPGELQAGDLAGLAALGAAGGCLDEPDPAKGRT
ncbi:MAG TPA: hypothetical protein VNB94_10300 [Mycobacteriales bacterium]|nr:hypothetical protein [Mycobacteriales bacterium]